MVNQESFKPLRVNNPEHMNISENIGTDKNLEFNANADAAENSDNSAEEEGTGTVPYCEEFEMVDNNTVTQDNGVTVTTSCSNLEDRNGNLAQTWPNQQLSSMEINNNLSDGPRTHPDFILPITQGHTSLHHYIPPPQYCPQEYQQVCHENTLPCSCPQLPHYPPPPPEYQELSPSTLHPQGFISSYQPCSPPSCPGPNVQWKWVGNGWVPLPSNVSYTMAEPSRRLAETKKRKVEIVLWCFIMFLLVIIGVLSYSHLQLLNSLPGPQEITLVSTTDQPHIPPMAHRPGSSPLQLTTD